MELIGNNDIQKQVFVAAQSAKEKNSAMPHMLFAGAAGCGKTSMARKIALINNTQFLTLLPDAIKKIDDVYRLFENLSCVGYDELGDRVGRPNGNGPDVKPAIIFIDEIHNLKPLQVQEWLGVAMEDFTLENKNGELLWIPYFTLVGATTNDGLLSKPFLDRFKYRFIFKQYSFEESLDIIRVHADRLKTNIDHSAAIEIAKRGRGTPRIIVGFLERCIDTAIVRKGNNIITKDIALETFDLLGINDIGLRETELRLMKILYESDKPIGLENLSIMTNESQKTITNSIEPFLIREGFVMRSGTGRILTENGKKYLLEDSGIYEKKKSFIKQNLPPGHIRR